MSGYLSSYWYCFIPVIPLTLLVIATIYLFFVKLILIPRRKARYFTKQGIKIIKLAGLDVPGDTEKILQKKDDIFHQTNREISTNAHTTAYYFSFGPIGALTLLDPLYIKEYLSLEYTAYQKSDMIQIFKEFVRRGILFAEGEQWKVLRKITSKSFNFEVLASHLQTIESTADWLYDKVENENLEKFNPLEMYQIGLGEVVGKIFFGENLTRYDYEGKSLCLHLASVIEQISRATNGIWTYLYGNRLVKLGLFASHRRLNSSIKKFRAVCQQIIDAQRKTETSKATLLKLFFDAQKDSEYSKYVNDNVIIDQFVTMFIGGTDTTSHLLTMTLYYLNKHPQMLQKLIRELDDVWPKGTPLDFQILNRLEYMHAFLKETLRMVPVLPFLIEREATKDHKLLDIQVQKGMTLMIDFYAIHRNPKYYKNPNEFDPERFLRKDVSEGFNKEPFAFMPFSAGPRNCIGQHLAMIEAKIFLAKFVRRFDFSLPKDYKLKFNFNGFYEPKVVPVFHLHPKA